MRNVTARPSPSPGPLDRKKSGIHPQMGVGAREDFRNCDLCSCSCCHAPITYGGIIYNLTIEVSQFFHAFSTHPCIHAFSTHSVLSFVVQWATVGLRDYVGVVS
jgi:hypothetical protein